MKTFFATIFFTNLLILNSLALAVGDKPSLRSLSTELKKGAEITSLFSQRNSLNSQQWQQVKGLFQSNATLKKKFFHSVQQSEAFARGEIEDEKILQFLTQLLQLSILQIRQASHAKNSALLWDEVETWFHFTADLSYEESTLVGLRLAHLFRSLLFDELEFLLKNQQALLVGGYSKAQALRIPWPVDRVILFEAKRALSGAAMNVAMAAAKEFQKNNYQSLAVILTHVKGGQAKDFDFLRKIWRDDDVDMMKNEVNRLQLIQAGCRWADHFARANKNPMSWQDLQIAAPIDYTTGRPMDWSRLIATMQKE